jgi:hypothetical protein
MPYIKQDMRKEWDEIAKLVLKILNEQKEEDKEGCLNYLITKILKNSYKPKYFNYNRVIGLLECIKLEFYRRQIAEYENLKIKENGDVE